MNLAFRELLPELMDDPAIDRAKHTQALAGLQRINRWSGTAHVLWRAISHIASERQLESVRVLDLACGGGDLVMALARKGQRHGPRIEVHGCDISPTAVDYATAAVQQTKNIGCQFFTHDAVQDGPLPGGYDIITSTLFLHHLTGSEATALLKKMAAAARHAILVDDLLRTRRGYWLAQLGCRVLSRSPVVRDDGPASVRGAFSMAEAIDLAATAGLQGAKFRTHWPQRFLLRWDKAA